MSSSPAAAESAPRRCMNAACGAAAAGVDWRKGWPLRSGGFAVLCDKCGLAYERLAFCDIFHQMESGWRECLYCRKRLHCGCIASKFSYDLIDNGGVQCISCTKSSGFQSIPNHPMANLLSSQRSFGRSNDVAAGRPFDLPPVISECKNDDIAAIGKSSPMLNLKILDAGQSSSYSKQAELEIEVGPTKWEQPTHGCRELVRVSSIGKNPGILRVVNDDNKDGTTESMTSESFSEACLSMSLGISIDGNKFEATSRIERPISLQSPISIAEGRELPITTPFQQAQRARHFLPKMTKDGQGLVCDAAKEAVSHVRVARPPAEGRGRNQLLPRYWPRITDQELQQISGDSNSTIVPLFEKVLSASDAGRIGRLVLPKACAEAYFPPISQPEGCPLTIQDAKGKEWHFQFRFWPNNNSRMYVLEGVTPCIQSLQLQAGDTVTFSRLEPGGKLVMGFRKATNTVSLPDAQISAIANGSFIHDTFFTSPNENISIVSRYSGLLPSLKGAADLHANSLSELVNSADEDVSWHKDKILARADEVSFQLLQKKSRNIGSKSRRLTMDIEEALELKLSWEESQDLLRPPASLPSTISIDDFEFEEYDEPPVFGKRTIFTVSNSGEQEQWVQCDDCSKWRRLPFHITVASRWTCTDNTWDPKSALCSAPDELNTSELWSILQQYRDLQRRRSYCSQRQNIQDLDSSGLDALATAATLGEMTGQPNVSIATTTKHPRHRPGCTCIVCIQPPSGKGPKHNQACTCNVCMTVRRRFKTLMMRKKQRQSEREEAEASKKIIWLKDDLEGTGAARPTQSPDSSRRGDCEIGSEVAGKSMFEKLETGKGDINIDLNFHPVRDGDQQSGSQSRLSMMGLLEVANRPLENYLKQNGLASLACEQGSSSSATVPHGLVDGEDRLANSDMVGMEKCDGCGGSTVDGGDINDKMMEDAFV